MAKTHSKTHYFDSVLHSYEEFYETRRRLWLEGALAEERIEVESSPKRIGMSWAMHSKFICDTTRRSSSKKIEQEGCEKEMPAKGI